MSKIACDLTTVLKCTTDARRWLQRFALPATKLRKNVKAPSIGCCDSLLLYQGILRLPVWDLNFLFYLSILDVLKELVLAMQFKWKGSVRARTVFPPQLKLSKFPSFEIYTSLYSSIQWISTLSPQFIVTKEKKITCCVSSKYFIAWILTTPFPFSQLWGRRNPTTVLGLQFDALFITQVIVVQEPLVLTNFSI